MVVVIGTVYVRSWRMLWKNSREAPVEQHLNRRSCFLESILRPSDTQLNQSCACGAPKQFFHSIGDESPSR
jgi:hypothetical protein